MRRALIALVAPTLGERQLLLGGEHGEFADLLQIAGEIALWGNRNNGAGSHLDYLPPARGGPPRDGGALSATDPGSSNVMQAHRTAPAPVTTGRDWLDRLVRHPMT